LKPIGTDQVRAAEGVHDCALDGNELRRVGGEFGERGALRIVQRVPEMAEHADLGTETLGKQPHDVRGLRAPGPAEQYLTHRIEELEGDRVPGAPLGGLTRSQEPAGKKTSAR
jgi:hypothetical protein